MKPPHNLWPLAIILSFVLFISGTIGLVVMASSQRTDLVSANYYEQELKYQTQIDRLQHARQLSAPATVAYDPASNCLCLSLPLQALNRNLDPNLDLNPSPKLSSEALASTPSHPVTGRIELYRPSAAALDREIKLAPDTNGRQVVDVSNLRPGLWKIRVTWRAGDQEYFTDQQLVIRPTQ